MGVVLLFISGVSFALLAIYLVFSLMTRFIRP